MNTIIAEVKELTREKFAEIASAIERLEITDSTIDIKYGTYCISHRPNIAPKAFAIWIFPGIDEITISQYEKTNKVTIPDVYRDFLYTMNGATIFKLDLFGIPLSMVNEPPTVDRSTVTPKDISIANKRSLSEKSNKENSIFVFGGGPWTLEERVRYFLNEKEQVFSFKSNGEQVGQWSSFKQFLKEEIVRVEKEYSKYEKYMSNLLSKHRSGNFESKQ